MSVSGTMRTFGSERYDQPRSTLPSNFNAPVMRRRWPWEPMIGPAVKVTTSSYFEVHITTQVIGVDYGKRRGPRSTPSYAENAKSFEGNSRPSEGRHTKGRRASVEGHV